MLFLLRPTRRGASRFSWGMHRSFVVRAKDKLSARQLAAEDMSPRSDASLWMDSKLTSCEELTGDGEPEVVLGEYVS